MSAVSGRPGTRSPSGTAPALPPAGGSKSIVIRGRCEAGGTSRDECEARAVAARQNYVDSDISGHLTVPGARPEEWLAFAKEKKSKLAEFFPADS